MGVVVVGPSGSGKTCLWKMLRTALAKIGQVVKQYTMNPKAMPRTQVSNEPQICKLNGLVFFLSHTSVWKETSQQGLPKKKRQIQYYNTRQLP